jgi:hypothetical protein
VCGERHEAHHREAEEQVEDGGEPDQPDRADGPRPRRVEHPSGGEADEGERPQDDQRHVGDDRPGARHRGRADDAPMQPERDESEDDGRKQRHGMDS